MFDATISNGNTTCSFNAQGAELKALDSYGISYLWPGDSSYWSRSSPLLFPFVGKLRNNRAQSAQGIIEHSQHGFARDLIHQIAKQTDNSISFKLTDTAETRKVYPYNFCLETTYTLTDEDSLEVYITVTNTGDTYLPFVVGGHPAFRVPLQTGEQFEDYRLRFGDTLTASSPLINLETGEIQWDKTCPVLNNQETLKLNRDIFAVDTLIFKDLPKGMITLESIKSGHGVVVSSTTLPYMAVWSQKKGSPFVALEPWGGMSTCSDEDDIFEHKRGICELEPGTSKTFDYTISILRPCHG